MWVRGLKRKGFDVTGMKGGVAPHVGAWIETHEPERKYAKTKSHPMWVRGLKPSSPISENIGARVAPHVGAWIETRLILSSLA